MPLDEACRGITAWYFQYLVEVSLEKFGPAVQDQKSSFLPRLKAKQTQDKKFSKAEQTSMGIDPHLCRIAPPDR